MYTGPRSCLVPFFALLFGTMTVVASAQTTVKKGPPPVTSPASGAEMYNAYCAACHGATGKGDGPAATALKTPPTNLTTLAAKTTGNSQLRKFIPRLRATRACQLPRTELPKCRYGEPCSIR